MWRGGHNESMKIYQNNLNKLFDSLTDAQLVMLASSLDADPGGVSEKLNEFCQSWEIDRIKQAVEESRQLFTVLRDLTP